MKYLTDRNQFLCLQMSAEKYYQINPQEHGLLSEPMGKRQMASHLTENESCSIMELFYEINLFIAPIA